MDAFVTRKRRRIEETAPAIDDKLRNVDTASVREDVDSTDTKIATLASLFPDLELGFLLDLLMSVDGSVEESIETLEPSQAIRSARKRSAPSIGFQASLVSFRHKEGSVKSSGTNLLPLTRRGKTLHLYSPEDIAAHTPCSIVHNFLPVLEANELLEGLLAEATTFGRQTFKVFDNVVQSPHSACFYVENVEEQHKQKTEYLYNGSFLEDVRQLTPQMKSVSSRVQPVVNKEIANRIKSHYPDGKKLQYQSPEPWVPNAAFVNCYNGGAESVGYVPREFRIRKILARDDDEGEEKGNKNSRRTDAEGQIAIHLPHNSLLVMHAEMQEEFKHSIHPAAAIDPHPIAGNKRINVTYRYYRENFHPRYTPRCRCGVATVLRCVQRSM
ncbi:MAG: hypothetical protein Q9195_003937 [Heterodermia aff. obscurata]